MVNCQIMSHQSPIILYLLHVPDYCMHIYWHIESHKFPINVCVNVYLKRATKVNKRQALLIPKWKMIQAHKMPINSAFSQFTQEQLPDCF